MHMDPSTSQLSAGAWLAQSLLLLRTSPDEHGCGGRVSSAPLPWKPPRMFTCQTECNTFPTPSQSLHGFCPSHAPYIAPLEAAVLIRWGLGKEVAITSLKSLWTFLVAWILLPGSGGKVQAPTTPFP